MTTFYTIDRANARLAEVRPILEDLAARRRELLGLRDRLHAATGAEVPGGRGSLVDDALNGAAGTDGPGSGRVLAARIQAVIDQMQAGVERLIAWDVTLRDIETGLVDFPALVSGRQVWLCWRLGEADIAWWHDLSTGVAGRRPLAELE
ncbi:MAG TPA: DUF2203 domain-containing protein [Patescibacteria group bacterium]|nr:DUF2203 domain-containing protein [Patescibacteria group bacterium]